MINQTHFGSSVRFFESGFCQRWGVDTYNDINKPCFFAGVYIDQDVQTINNHKGLKIVWNTRWNDKIKAVFKRINPENVVVCVGMGIPFDLEGYKVKNASFHIKDFSAFTPNMMGNSVYCYIGNERHKHRYGFEMMEAVKSKIPFPVIYGLQGHDMTYVKDYYYNKCFVNIKMDQIGGMTTATELALMGRRSISQAKLPFCDYYNSEKDIIDLIYREAKKMYTIQSSQIGDFFNADKEWRNVDFWL